jgi:PKD repeat protein
MKKILRLTLISLSLLLQTALLANTVIVKGYIVDTNKKAVANKKVNIYTDSTIQGCVIAHTVITNPNGYYIDTLTCNGDIRKIKIDVEDCTGKHIINEPSLTASSNIIESNFIICIANTIASCNAVFSIVPITPGTGLLTTASGIKFSSAGSAAPSGDSIITRTWYFGDSTQPLTGNITDPTHYYTKSGTYNACLSIKTKSGCESKYCLSFTIRDTVPVIAPVPTTCRAFFTYTIKADTIKLNSIGSLAASSTDSIISRTWYFSDSSTNATNGSTISGNIIDPSHLFAKPGTYTIYLVIKTKKGCESKYYTTVTIPPVPTNCKAAVSYTVTGTPGTSITTASLIHFSSRESTAPGGDSIISRKWFFGDSSNTSVSGFITDSTHRYTKAGTYNVCLYITTKLGCESRYCTSISIHDTVAVIPTTCKAYFTATISGNSIKLNSSSSLASSSTDSIISRYWIFGDSTSIQQGNSIDPTHTYAKEGNYQVILYIKTKSGCESKYAATIVIANTPPFHCEAQAEFDFERISLKKIQFNSSSSKAQIGDSIISRTWNFGDSTILTGNEINPVKEFANAGYYNTCLLINTAKGCESKICKEVTILDTVTTPQSSIDYIKIISINPNPVISKMVLTVWSRNSNTEAEISVYDVYGASKFSIKKLLAQGNNSFDINTESLYNGPYFITVSTKNGKDSRQFYKL